MLRSLSIIAAGIVFSTVFADGAYAQNKTLRTIVVDAGHGGEDAGAVAKYENSLRSKEKDVTLAISKKLIAELKKQLPEVKVIPTRTTDVFDNVKVKAQKAREAKGDLFLCIHADSGPLKTGRRQIGTRTVTRYKVSYIKKGKKRIKKATPYEVEEGVYETFIMPGKARGTTVYIFAAHKNGIVLDQIMKGGENDAEIQFDANPGDSIESSFNYNSPEGRQLAQIYAKLYQEKSDRLAGYVNDEIAGTGRPALGVNQRQTGIWVLEATRMPAILVETGYINNPEDERYINSEEGQQELAEVITRAVIRYKNQLESTKTTAKTP